MTRQRWREDFIAQMAWHGIQPDTSRSVLRDCATIKRMSEAACNGDWPCDNGERKVAECKRCEGLVVPSTLKGPDRLCDECRAEDRVRSKLADFEQVASVSFAGDPRGWTTRIVFQDGREAGW